MADWDNREGLWNYLPVRYLTLSYEQAHCNHRLGQRLMRMNGDQCSVVLTCPECGIDQIEQYRDVLRTVGPSLHPELKKRIYA
jgi:hypothetical protein